MGNPTFDLASARHSIRARTGAPSPHRRREGRARPWPRRGRRNRGTGPHRGRGRSGLGGLRGGARGTALPGLPLVVGGRSLGARVACRTVERTGAAAVLCLAYPLVPPRRGEKLPQSRLPELEAVTVPVLVVQGESDRFGMPPEGEDRKVVKVPGDHGLKADTGAVAEAVREWLANLRLPAAAPAP
jgi:predicted alpha/beta-hydrolase family hydrolase